MLFDTQMCGSRTQLAEKANLSLRKGNKTGSRGITKNLLSSCDKFKFNETRFGYLN